MSFDVDTTVVCTSRIDLDKFKRYVYALYVVYLLYVHTLKNCNDAKERFHEDALKSGIVGIGPAESFVTGSSFVEFSPSLCGIGS
jgi:hypothetical protein